MRDESVFGTNASVSIFLFFFFFNVCSIFIDAILKDVIGTFLTFMTPI